MYLHRGLVPTIRRKNKTSPRSKNKIIELVRFSSDTSAGQSNANCFSSATVILTGEAGEFPYLGIFFFVPQYRIYTIKHILFSPDINKHTHAQIYIFFLSCDLSFKHRSNSLAIIARPAPIYCKELLHWLTEGLEISRLKQFWNVCALTLCYKIMLKISW